jgi:hypothetical protein
VVRTRVGILLDLTALQDEARHHGGELSYRKLRRGIAGDRDVARAVCLLPADAPEAAAAAMTASGFEPRRTSGAELAALTTAAGECRSRADVLMVVPATGPMADLVRNQQEQNLPVETAGFADTPIPGVPHRRLGRDCVFVP